MGNPNAGSDSNINDANRPNERNQNRSPRRR
jgi:hypothetical protein